MAYRHTLAYKPVYVHPLDALDHKLRFDASRKNLDGGRMVVLVMPEASGRGARGTLIHPTSIELRQAHKLGMYLIDFAMSGTRVGKPAHPIAAIIDLPKELHEKVARPIAIPLVFSAMKQDQNTWRAGFFAEYMDRRDSHFVEHETVRLGMFKPQTFRGFQAAADWMCDSVGAVRIRLGRPSLHTQKSFYPLKKRQLALITVAKAHRERHDRDEVTQAAKGIEDYKRIDAHQARHLRGLHA